MELPPIVQLREAGSFLLLGGLLGLWCDILGGLRDVSRASLLPDALLTLSAAAALFLGGMATLEGGVRLYMPAFLAAGWALWARGVSPAGRPLWRSCWEKAALLLRPARAAAAFFGKIGKKVFSNGKKWFTIIRQHRRAAEKKRREARSNETSGRRISDHPGDRGTHRVRVLRTVGYESQGQ